MHNTPRYLKVQGHDGLVRDTATNAILNINNAEYENYLKQREMTEKKEAQLQLISQNTEDIISMKNDLQELKSLIYQLLNTKG